MRKVAAYPVVYQVTKTATRVLGTDARARRPHTIQIVRSRLLGVNFYLEASRWPATFLLDHDEKVAAFLDAGCPLGVLPERSGSPYLWEEFVLRLADGRLCVAHIDLAHRSAFLQLWELAKRFRGCVEQLKDRLQLLIVTGSEARHRLYGRMAQKPSLLKLSQGRFKIAVSLYRVRRPVPFMHALTWPNNKLSEETDE